MCDTLVALGNATADGSVILAKNSDRQPNEAHVLARIPRARHGPGETLQCTHISIPQVAETHEVLLSRPFWIWGAEMGANEHGVAIANEAVFTKEPYDKAPGLIGMDFLRLALERARGGAVVTQPDMYSVKRLGLLKIDILGQRSLAGSNAPLVVIDGVPVESDIPDTANQEDVLQHDLSPYARPVSAILI